MEPKGVDAVTIQLFGIPSKWNKAFPRAPKTRMSAASASDYDISEDTIIARKQYFEMSKENLEEHWKLVSDEPEENGISTKLHKKAVNGG